MRLYIPLLIINSISKADPLHFSAIRVRQSLSVSTSLMVLFETNLIIAERACLVVSRFYPLDITDSAQAQFYIYFP